MWPSVLMKWPRRGVSACVHCQPRYPTGHSSHSEDESKPQLHPLAEAARVPSEAARREEIERQLGTRIEEMTPADVQEFF